ncbi:PIN domain-containing protein [Agrococcus sp. KRD186]|uniref:PIN domain-containing protein n=1 Tax=Agrococcus sp. KRD186 TaxID=2729730 RepID=UPI0019CF5570
MNVVDANVVVGFLDSTNANHARAVELLGARESEPLVMHEVTMAEVLAGPAQVDRAAAERVWTSMLQMGIRQAATAASPLDVAQLRASTGLPIPDCLVILTAGKPATGHPILTFDEWLAAKARALGYSVAP